MNTVYLLWVGQLEDKKMSLYINTVLKSDVATELVIVPDDASVLANRTITSADISGIETIFECDASATRFIYTLPDRISSIGKVLCFKNIKTGIARIQRAGADVIGSSSRTVEDLFTGGNMLVLYAGNTNWEYAEKPIQTLQTNWKNQSAWQNKRLGSPTCTYDNLTGTYEIGEVVKEYTNVARTLPSGIEGRILHDSGTKLLLYDVAGGGVFTNNLYLKGVNSGTTSDVNEGTGSSKNLDSNFYHGLGLYFPNFEVKFLLSTDGTENNTYMLGEGLAATGAGDYGFTEATIDNNNISVNTTSQIVYFTAGGGLVLLDTENYYYNMMLERKI